ncbi:MAG: YicC/YloC family endoribonuclease [Candidatus Anammoxibacter sp.]
MISSMTGFGSAESTDDEKLVYVEVKTVNNRFLKIKIKSPEFINGHEQELEKLIKEKISRGSISLIINYKAAKKDPVCNINFDNLKAYHKMFKQAKKEIGSDNDISIDSLISLPGVIERTISDDTETEQLTETIYNLVSDTLEDLKKMRMRGGKDIAAAITKITKKISSLLKEVKRRTPEMLANYTQRLQERIAKLTKNSDITITKDDLCKEIAIFADRSDITEEINLLNSHLGQLSETLKKKEPVGKKLEFIVQEMFRESNTMGSKSNDDKMLNSIFDIKTEIEKIKELVLNVE